MHGGLLAFTPRPARCRVPCLHAQDFGVAGSSPAELRRSYAEALDGDKGDGVHLHLLRLMQRTGPVWNELGHAVCLRLLGAFIACLQGKAVRAGGRAGVGIRSGARGGLRWR